jgi:SET domain-containing protein
VTASRIATVRTRETTPVAVVRANSEYRLVLIDHVCAGTWLFTIDGEFRSAPTRYSVQVGRNLHIDLPAGYGSEEVLDRFYWRFTNHSCEPNAVVRGRDMLALACIEPWQQITFNYNTTEYDMAEPFDCRCGSSHCAGRIRGFRWLSPGARERIRPWLADHLQSIPPAILGEHPPVALSAAGATLCR